MVHTTHLIEVAFRGNRKEFFRFDAESPPALHAGIIVEVDRGEDFGRVHSTGELAEVRCKGCSHGCGTTTPTETLRAALRLATPDDVARDAELTAENESARKRAMERVKANGLVMKLTDAEWQWDRRKLTFYFTSERRVDFRVLVRDLAAMFRARIELKQIGVRDEAKRLSGVGRCGREYCSASWLPDLRPVNLGVAKDQKLSLNPQQISGACGRLMCCLRYEHEFYVQSRRRFPKEGRILVTAVGEEKVISCDIFNDRVTLRSAEGDTRVVPLAELKDAVGGAGVEAPPTPDRSDDVLDHMMRDTDEYAVKEREILIFANPEDVDVEAQAGERNAVVETPEIAPSVASTEKPSTESVPDVPPVPAASAAASAAASTAASTAAADGTTDNTDTEPRRKRRRGRRGGRRLRAAEQRRHGQDRDSDDDSDNDRGTDRNNDRHNDRHNDRSDSSSEPSSS